MQISIELIKINIIYLLTQENKNVILVFMYTYRIWYFNARNRRSMLNCGFYPNKIIK